MSADSVAPPASRTCQCGSMRASSAPRRTSTPASHSSVVMSSPARSPRRSRLRALLGRDEDDLDAAAHQRGRRLAGDEAGADDHGARARLRQAAQAKGVVDRADGVQVGIVGAPSTGGRCGAEPVASTQAS